MRWDQECGRGRSALNLWFGALALGLAFAAAALGIDYEQVGYESGQMAAMFLSGQKTMAQIPVQRASKGLLAINTRAAADQGVTFPAAVMAQVRQTFDSIAAPKP